MLGAENIIIDRFLSVFTHRNLVFSAKLNDQNVLIKLFLNTENSCQRYRNELTIRSQINELDLPFHIPSLIFEEKIIDSYDSVYGIQVYPFILGNTAKQTLSINPDVFLEIELPIICETLNKLWSASPIIKKKYAPSLFNFSANAISFVQYQTIICRLGESLNKYQNLFLDSSKLCLTRNEQCFSNNDISLNEIKIKNGCTFWFDWEFMGFSSRYYDIASLFYSVYMNWPQDNFFSARLDYLENFFSARFANLDLNLFSLYLASKIFNTLLISHQTEDKTRVIDLLNYCNKLHTRFKK